MSQIGELNKLVEKITGKKEKKQYNTIKKCLDAISTFRSGEKVKSYNMESAIKNVTKTYVGGSSAELQEKSVTVTENGSSIITPDEGYDGISKVNLTVNSMGEIDWTEIGYQSMPGIIEDAFQLSKDIADNWDESTTSMLQMFKVDAEPNRVKPFFMPFVNTSNVTIMLQAFFNNTGLLAIPLLDTSNVTNFGNAFQGCVNLVSVPQFDTSNVTNFGSAFAGCTNLVDVPVFNLSKLPSWNTTSFSLAFSNCPNLSNDSLNNIMATCITATDFASGAKKLKQIGLSQEQATICQGLSNYDAFVAAGWSTGY